MVCGEVYRNDRGKFEVAPDFDTDKIVFHPIPHDLWGKLKEGEWWCGEYGRLRPTGKKDVYGKPIYIQFFIPKERKIYYVADIHPTVIKRVPLLKIRKMSGDVELGETYLQPHDLYVDCMKSGCWVYVLYKKPDVNNIKGGLLDNINGEDYYVVQIGLHDGKAYYNGEELDFSAYPHIYSKLKDVIKRDYELRKKYEEEQRMLKRKQISMLNKEYNRAVKYCLSHQNPPAPKHIKYWLLPVAYTETAAVEANYYLPEDLPYVTQSLKYFDAVEKILGLKSGEYSTEIEELAEDTDPHSELGAIVRKLVKYVDFVLNRCAWRIIYDLQEGKPPGNVVRGPGRGKEAYIVDWKRSG